MGRRPLEWDENATGPCSKDVWIFRRPSDSKKIWYRKQPRYLKRQAMIREAYEQWKKENPDG